MTQSIDSIMKTTMENLKEMVDVNKVVGKQVAAGDGTVVIPVSKVSFGFVTGGGEYRLDSTKKRERAEDDSTPCFAGGTGSGVSVSPVGFLVVCNGSVRMVSTQIPSSMDRAIETIPALVCEIKKALTECICKAGEEDPAKDRSAKGKERSKAAPAERPESAEAAAPAEAPPEPGSSYLL